MERAQGPERWCWKQGEEMGTDTQGAVSIWRDDKILNVHYVDGCTTLSILKSIGLHTLKR